MGNELVCYISEQVQVQKVNAVWKNILSFMTLRTDTCGDDSSNDAIGIYIDAIGICIE